MRKKISFSSSFWIGERKASYLKLDSISREMLFYLSTTHHSTMIGIYLLPIGYIANDLGCSIEGASKGLSRLIDEGFCSYDFTSEYIWVHEMAADEFGKPLKNGDKRIGNINDLYESMPELSFIGDFYDKYCDFLKLKTKKN